MDDQFSDELKKAVEEGFVAVDDQNQIAVFDDEISPSLKGFEIIAFAKRRLGLQAELTIRHNYR